VLITVTAIAVSAYLTGALGLLLIDDFKINLTIVAAFLTIIGYSINDTIVIYDRVREIRGKSPKITPEMINTAINQTLARTILTAWTVLLVTLILYIFGGEGIHGFAFAMIVGSISGTYSTLAIATPLTHHPRTLWVVTVVLAGLTLAGLAWMIPSPTLSKVLSVVILVLSAAALFGLYRNFSRQDRAGSRVAPA